MRKLLFLTLTVLFLLVVGGCGSVTKGTVSPVGNSGQSANHAADMSNEQREIVDTKAGYQTSGQQKIITTVNLVMVVYDVGKTVSEINKILQKVDGHIQEANLWHTNDQPQCSMTLRVPAAILDKSLLSLEALGKVENKNVSSQDITEEHYDIEARKNNLKNQEARYLELLNKANTVKDMLEIENELTRVRGEIESLEARLKVLNSQVDLATISLELRSPQGLSTGETLREPFSQRIRAGWQRGVNGMINLVQDLLVLVVILLPYIPILALGGYLIFRVCKVRLTRKKSSGEKL